MVCNERFFHAESGKLFSRIITETIRILSECHLIFYFGVRMNKIIAAMCQDQLWKKWVEINSAQGTGCVSAPKEGCVSVVAGNTQAKEGCVS